MSAYIPRLPPEERALFDVYQRILDSADLGKEVADNIRAGNWAPGALRDVIQTSCAPLRKS